jgi:hypothetical protein
MPDAMSGDGFYGSSFASHALLSPTAMVARSLLWQCLARDEANALEVEELAISLLAAAPSACDVDSASSALALQKPMRGPSSSHPGRTVMDGRRHGALYYSQRLSTPTPTLSYMRPMQHRFIDGSAERRDQPSCVTSAGQPQTRRCAS